MIPFTSSSAHSTFYRNKAILLYGVIIYFLFESKPPPTDPKSWLALIPSMTLKLSFLENAVLNITSLPFRAYLHHNYKQLKTFLPSVVITELFSQKYILPSYSVVVCQSVFLRFGIGT